LRGIKQFQTFCLSPEAVDLIQTLPQQAVEDASADALLRGTLDDRDQTKQLLNIFPVIADVSPGCVFHEENSGARFLENCFAAYFSFRFGLTKSHLFKMMIAGCAPFESNPLTSAFSCRSHDGRHGPGQTDCGFDSKGAQTCNHHFEQVGFSQAEAKRKIRCKQVFEEARSRIFFMEYARGEHVGNDGEMLRSCLVDRDHPTCRAKAHRHWRPQPLAAQGFESNPPPLAKANV